MNRLFAQLIMAGLCLFAGVMTSLTASFPGTARVEVADPTGGLSWTNSANACTISCWFKLSVPSDKTLTENMTILVNRKTGSESDRFAYLLRYNIANGAIEFLSRGSSGLFSETLIQAPYMDRWYHVAVVRQAEQVIGYVDGRQMFSSGTSIGNAANTDGVSIGGWGSMGSGNYLLGEVQEVAIYQTALGVGPIRSYMYRDQAELGGLKGYFKLGYSTNTADQLKNFAPTPPAGTSNGVSAGTGLVTFEEVDQAGEQSIYDSQKNRGQDAIAPLSGSFTWDQTIFARPTPGVAFQLEYGYSSANAFSGGRLGEFDAFSDPPLGPGWRHSFETMLAPENISGERNLIMWNGSVETWNLTNGTWRTRHKEYRGELTELADGTGDYIWTTPDRLVYRFRNPLLGEAEPDYLLAGRLLEIRDFNSDTNRIRLLRRPSDGVITQALDSANGAYLFNYAGTRLTNVTFGGWAVDLAYDTTNRLIGVSRRGPVAYSPVNTRWSFFYNIDNGLLDRIQDPRSNDAIRLRYDKYGRMTNELDALGYINATAYGVPDKRSITRTDEEGFKWVDTFDRKGRPISRKDPLGYAVAYEYDGVGNVVAETDPLGNRTRYAYDERSNKTAETNALGQVSRWRYHATYNKPIEAIDPLGWTNCYDYDPAGNLVRHYDAIGILVTYVYTSNGLVESSTDGNGNISRMTYMSAGFLAAATDPATNTTTFGRNEWGWVTAVTNALEEVTTSSHNINGQVIRTVDALNRVITAVYDANGNLLTQTDAKGQETAFFYDAENQRTQVVDRVGSVSKTAYNPRGEVLTQTDPLLNVTRLFYDAAGRLTNTVDALGGAVAFEYDGNDNRVATIDKLGALWTTSFDQLDRPIRQVDPLGNTTRTEYDSVGRIKTITSPNGYPSIHQYNGRGRLVRWVDAENYVWLYDYDGNGNITNVTDALGGHYIMAYGPRNERAMEKNQDGNEWRYTYDELMRLKTQRDPNGLVRSATYDPGGRPVEVNYSSGRIDSFLYDENNNPEAGTRSGSGPATTTLFTYDALDRVTEYRDHFGNRVKYRFDRLGGITNIVYPGNLVLHQVIDPLGRLTNQTDWAGRQTAYAYDKVGRLVQRKYPNGIIQTNGFDEAGRIVERTYQDLAWQPDPTLSGTGSQQILYLPLDGNAFDVSGNNHSGTVFGATWTTDRRGRTDKACRFDGDDYIEIGQSSNINFTSGGFTLCAWIRFDQDSPDNHIVGKHYTGQPTGYFLRLLDNKPSFFMWGDHVTAPTSCRDGNWHFVVGTWNGTNRVLYVDGNVSVSASGSQSAAPNNAPICIGRAIPTQTSVYFKGDIDEGRLYARALNTNEVNRLYQDQIGDIQKLNIIALTYAYDRNGNKTGATEKGSLDWAQPSMIDETARYTPANRLIDRVDVANTNRSFVYHYDPSGNMTNASSAEQGYRLTYDEDNRVMSVRWEMHPLTDKTIVNRYDVLGRRLSRTLDGVETRYILNVVGGMERVLCDQNSAGQITAYYIHGPDLCYAVDAVGNSVNYHSDAMGNVIALTDSNKSVVAQYAYTPYGRVLGVETDSGQCALVVNNPYLFVGSQGVMRDIQASDLYFMRARYYSADAGVFLSTDPVKHIGPGWKPVAYIYGGGNPVRYQDPEGEYAIADDLVVSGLGALWGIAKQGMSDAVAGKLSGWEDYVGAAFGGAVGFELKYHFVGLIPGVGGAAEGAVKNLTSQALKNATGKQEGFNAQAFGMATVVGAASPYLAPESPYLSQGSMVGAMLSGASRADQSISQPGKGGNGMQSSIIGKTTEGVNQTESKNAVQAIKTTFATASKSISSAVNTAVQKTQQVVSTVKSTANIIVQSAKTTAATVKTAVTSTVSKATSAVKSVASKVKSFFSKKK